LAMVGNDTWPLATEGSEGNPAALRVSLMAKPNLHELAERCPRLARDSTDLTLLDGLLKLADERAGAKDNIAAAPTSSDDQSGA
jgi:hypothetical protein